MAQRSRAREQKPKPPLIVWAVDPFEESGPVRTHVEDSLRALVRRTKARVLPIHIFSVSETSPNVDPAIAALKLYLQRAAIPGCLEPCVLFESMTSRSRAAELLLDRALTEGAELVVAGSHGRSTWARWLMGSFAESLLLRAPLPVLLISRRALPLTGHWNTLFATDLGQPSRRLFEESLPLLRRFGGKLTLFHSAPNPIEPVVQSGILLLGGAWVPVHPYFARDTEARNRKLRAWANHGQRRGVRVLPRLISEPGSVAGHAVRCVEDVHADLVVAAPHGGPIRSAIAGSVARQMARQLDVPLLILHSNERAEKTVPFVAA
jgi:nucleotide-binding universal stress UspA family protein